MGWQSPAHRTRHDRLLDEGSALRRGDDAFWASPVGRAAHAPAAGRPVLPDRAGRRGTRGVRRGRRPSAARRGATAHPRATSLGQIEELGWHLEHVSWWRVDDFGATATADRPGAPSTTPTRLRPRPGRLPLPCGGRRRAARRGARRGRTSVTPPRRRPVTAPNAVPGGRATRRRLRAWTAASAVACHLLVLVGRSVGGPGATVA